MFISGMGFFTDAYDLFIIGVVMALMKQRVAPSPVGEGLVTSTALLASAVGAILFGRIADMLGRKRIYGYEVLVLAAGAIASAFSPEHLVADRLPHRARRRHRRRLPVSATIMSEYAGKKSRGMMVSLVFAMQAAGLIVGPLLAAACWRADCRMTCLAVAARRSALFPRSRCSRCAVSWRKRPAICWRPASTKPFTKPRASAGRTSGQAARRGDDHGEAAKESFWKGFRALTDRATG